MSQATGPITSVSWFHADASTPEIGALHVAMDALAIGVAILEVQPQGAPIMVAHNEAYRRFVVQPPILGEALTQLPYACFGADRTTPVPLAEMPGPRALRSGEAVRDTELHVRRPDGVWRVLAGSAAVSKPDGQGGPRRVVVLVRDITEHREIVRELDEPSFQCELKSCGPRLLQQAGVHSCQLLAPFFL